jgi:hypothetical protein
MDPQSAAIVVSWLCLLLGFVAAILGGQSSEGALLIGAAVIAISHRPSSGGTH